MPANSQRIGVIRSFDDQTTEIMRNTAVGRAQLQRGRKEGHCAKELGWHILPR
jgi:hypothetical protein